MIIKVYSKPACIQCTATQKLLQRLGLAFEEIDLTHDAAALAEITALGYRQAPVVKAGDDHWSGFRPDLIRLTARIAN